jgi:signal transduction histidine kinase
MKLINKASRAFLLSSFLAALIGGLFSNLILNRIMNNEANEHLVLLKKNVTNYIDENGRLPENDIFFSDSCWFVPAKSFGKAHLRDTLIYDQLENELFDYRVLSFGVEIESKFFTIHIQKPLYETEDLSEALFISFVIIIILMISSLLIVNYIYSIKLWKPFYQTLNQLTDFKVTDLETLQHPKTDILEFNLLQQKLDNLTHRVQRDYLSLKAFTENASHEMQTPLAIISTNLEFLIQDSNLTSSQLEQINELMEAVRRLSKLNQTLLLLTKIENRQFSETETVNISEVLSKKLASLKPWIDQKEIILEESIVPNIKLNLNPYLLDVLFNNLMSNAIKYNRSSGGMLKVSLHKDSLKVSNTGERLTKGVKTLFERFQKGSDSQESMGLGLAIVEQICETYDYRLNYDYQDSCHLFKIEF